MVYGRSGIEVNGIEQGEIYITVTSSEDEPLEDVRDLVKKTAVITSPLNDITLAVGESNIQTIELSDGATVTATSESSTVATGTYADGKLTIAGVAAGNTMINLVVSKTGEATSYRTIAVTVESE